MARASDDLDPITADPQPTDQMTNTDDPNGEPAVPIPRHPSSRTVGAPAPTPTTSNDVAEAGPGTVRRGAVRARFGRI